MSVGLKPKPMLPVAADAGTASRNTAAASTAGTSAMAFIFIFQAFPSCHRESVAHTAGDAAPAAPAKSAAEHRARASLQTDRRTPTGLPRRSPHRAGPSRNTEASSRRLKRMNTSFRVLPLVGVDLVAAGGDDVPLGTELVQPLPDGVAWPAVAGVVVERVTVVGHLGSAGGAGAVSEHGTAHAVPGPGGTVAEVGRPGAGAGALAGGFAGRVRLEQVQGVSLPVDQGLPQLGAAEVDHRGHRGAA